MQLFVVLDNPGRDIGSQGVCVYRHYESLDSKRNTVCAIPGVVDQPEITGSYSEGRYSNSYDTHLHNCPSGLVHGYLNVRID